MGLQEEPNKEQTPEEPRREEEVEVAGKQRSDPAPEVPAAPKTLKTADELINQFMSMSEDSFIPWEDVTLPSQGEYYGGRIPGGIVRVRAMGVHADKILATQRLAQTGQSLDYLFKHCVELPGDFDPLDLLTGDRVFLLYVLRGITHGNLYEFMLDCPSCEYKSTHTYDLNELAQTMQGPKPELGPEPFKVTLPYMSEALGQEVWAKIRLMRGHDVTQLTQRQRFNKRVRAGAARRDKQVVIEEAVAENLVNAIASVGGEGLQGEVKDPIKIKGVVGKMHARDTATIREFLRENSPGIDTSIEVDCPECGNHIRTELPITETFFRPTPSRSTRE